MIYRKYFKNDEHIRLAGVVTKIETPWLVGYDKSEFISTLYKTSKFQYVYADYQAGNLKRGIKELLISNKKVPSTDQETGEVIVSKEEAKAEIMEIS